MHFPWRTTQNYTEQWTSNLNLIYLHEFERSDRIQTLMFDKFTFLLVNLIKNSRILKQLVLMKSPFSSQSRIFLHWLENGLLMDTNCTVPNTVIHSFRTNGNISSQRKKIQNSIGSKNYHSCGVSEPCTVYLPSAITTAMVPITFGIWHSQGLSLPCSMSYS